MEGFLGDLFKSNKFLAGTNKQTIYSFKTYNNYTDISISKMSFKVE